MTISRFKQCCMMLFVGKIINKVIAMCKIYSIIRNERKIFKELLIRDELKK